MKPTNADEKYSASLGLINTKLRKNGYTIN